MDRHCYGILLSTGFNLLSKDLCRITIDTITTGSGTATSQFSYSTAGNERPKMAARNRASALRVQQHLKRGHTVLRVKTQGHLRTALLTSVGNSN